jgi:hypothetical protein
MARTEEVARLLGRENPWRAEPHERYRGETNPEGAGRSKPARGCKTLKPDRAEVGNLGLSGLPTLHVL